MGIIDIILSAAVIGFYSVVTLALIAAIVEAVIIYRKGGRK